LFFTFVRLGLEFVALVLGLEFRKKSVSTASIFSIELLASLYESYDRTNVFWNHHVLLMHHLVPKFPKFEVVVSPQ
jgi:hypothetical protein